MVCVSVYVFWQSDVSSKAIDVCVVVVSFLSYTTNCLFAIIVKCPVAEIDNLLKVF